MTKKERIAAQIERETAKRQEITDRIAELERQLKEEETLEIQKMIRQANLTTEEFAELLKNSPLVSR